jgi:threonine aldolase
MFRLLRPHRIVTRAPIHRSTTRSFTMTSAASLPTPVSANGDGSHTEFNAWSSPGPSAHDFRSDTMTTPNLSMLEAIKKTTLLDDVFLEDPTTNDLEAHIADLTGHEAALLVMSGTMGNQIALRTHLTSPPYSLVCDHRGHIIRYEAGGVALLTQAMTLPIIPSNKHHLTLADIKKHAIISDDVHACPTRLISLENTLNGTVMPLSDFREIAGFAKEHGMALHLDGARIWEVASTGKHGSLRDFTSLCSSVSLCFSKGLGAPIGSILVGSKSFITRARQIRKMLGGGTRQAGVISAAARVAVDEQFGKGPNGEGGKLRATHERARGIAALWEKKGGKLTSPTETNMVWLDLEAAGVTGEEMVEAGKKHGLKMFPGRVVVHYQIGDDAVRRLERVLDDILALGKTNGTAASKKRKADAGPENVYANGSKTAKVDDRDET